MGMGVPETVFVAAAVAVAVAVAELVGLHAAKKPIKIKINRPKTVGFKSLFVFIRIIHLHKPQKLFCKTEGDCTVVYLN